MDTERIYANGIPGKEKAIKDESNTSAEEEKVTSPLLHKTNDLKYIDSAQDDYGVRVANKAKNDLNTVNSIKTESNIDGNNLAVTYHKDGKNEDGDATSTNEGVKFLGLGDADSICSSKPPQDTPQIPDGGWGWVVVAASFFIATVADGLAFSYGLLHQSFVKHFHTNDAETSLIGGLFISVPLILGPVMSALVDRYGCRNMTILGSVASTFGFVAAAFSNSVGVLYVTYGILAGLGMGLLYVTAVVSIAYWFDKRRNLAVGLGSCGVGFGTFVYAPLTAYLLENYGWRSTILLLAGTVINVCVCGAVMRDPEWLTLQQKKQRQLNKSKKTSSTYSISAKSGGGESVYPGVEELKSLMKSGETPEYILTALVTSIAEAEHLEATTKMNADLSQQHKVSSVINLPTFLKQSERLPQEVLEQLQANKRLYNIILQNYPSLLALRSNSEHRLPIEPPPEVSKAKPVTMSMKLKLSRKEKKDKKDFEKKLDQVKQQLLQPIPENKQAVIAPRCEPSRQLWWTDRHYLREIRVHRNSIMHRGAMMNIAKYKLRTSSCPDIYRNSMWSVEEDQGEKTFWQRIMSAFNKTFDFNMFTEFHFLMMNLSTLVLFVWFIVPYFYVSDLMIMNKYSNEDGAYILSVFGAASIVGIVGLGWIGDLPWVNVTKTYAVCLIICGINIICFPILIKILDHQQTYSFYIIAVNATMFGLMFSSSYAYTPSILVELIALERFTMAYGLVLLSQGVGHLVGPTLAGALKDSTGDWDASFYVAGIWVVISGLLVGVIPYTKNFRICGNAPLAKDVASDPEPGVKIIIAH
ncbi:major facilitator superfamily domain-containing protein [Phthorimaea operculella]|nr:major facilitator superfamily domain-containing protein [Phthorimaea operculella]